MYLVWTLSMCLRECVYMCMCFFIPTWLNLYKYVIRETTTTYAHLYVGVIYYEDEAGTRTFRLLVLCYMRAIGHVLTALRCGNLQIANFVFEPRLSRIFSELFIWQIVYGEKEIFRLGLLLIFNSFETGDVLCASYNVYLIYRWRNICVKQGESSYRCQTPLKT